MLNRRRSRDEQGAVAVIVALCSLVMFGLAAITVDLGSAFVRERDVQNQADFAALAAGPNLPATKAAADPAVVAVANYLNRNQPARDDASFTCSVSQSCVTASDLVDGVSTNGEVTLNADGTRITVTTPQTYVKFGLAGAVGVSGANITRNATVEIGSPDGLGVFPMYVATGNLCDYGLQTLQQPSGGHTVPPTVPPLYADSDTNENDLTGIQAFDAGSPVLTLGVSSTTAYIQLSASKYKDATRVGFFNPDGSAPVMVDRNTWTAPAGTGPYTANNATITVPVPQTVTDKDDLWWVRVYQAGTNNKWSARPEAQPLSVGFAPFECVSGSTDGNFGTIKLPRTDSVNQQNADGWIPRNFARGLQPPLTLDIFPNAQSNWECSTGTVGAIISDASNLKPRTNCVDTDTGLTKNTVTPGLVTGKTGAGGYTGMLVRNSSSADPDGSGGCSRAGNTSPTTKTIGSNTYQLNDDLLTCFLTDMTTQLGDVARAGYPGPAVFSPEIYDSPRFGWVPVFGKLATSGGSAKYQIVEFRPTFITDQPMSATKGNNNYNTGTENGLGWTAQGDIERLKVVYLNFNALPNGEAHTPFGPYLGVGPKLIRLTN